MFVLFGICVYKKLQRKDKMENNQKLGLISVYIFIVYRVTLDLHNVIYHRGCFLLFNVIFMLEP